ncbi:pseudouridine synthase [Sphaerotilus mobilis]|uniref:Pseudouridine synthase n=1 Tax=Sphaerotilus mobilis TaxID=47994 RepID=A0A4Q7LW75_9BURK|nr:pseudouridine synthase [Sphaerotilus mobilis]RZS58662.1 ribosomal large subunit pseudouridine synthase B [Sphaerotilus mobilis]
MNDLPESNDPTPAEAASASAPAPRRRAPRKTAPAAPVESTAAVPEAAAVAPAKAPRRRSPARDASPIEQAAAAAAESLAAPVAVVEATAEPLAEPLAEVKPKAPRKRKVAEAVEGVAEAVAEVVPEVMLAVETVAVDASSAEPAPKRPRSRKPAADVSAPADVTPAPAEAVVDANADVTANAAVTEAAGDAGEASEGQAPQDRNARRRERRNRRDRDRPRGNGEDGATVAAAPADGAGEGAAVLDGGVVAEPVDAGELFAEVLSGQFDIEPAEEVAAEPTKRVLRPEPEAPKLHKVLAQSGVGSRRDMEQLIQDGQVTVNGEVAHVGMRIAHGDQIKIAGRPVKVRIAPGPARILAYHKPVGEVVTHHDPDGRPTVFRGLPRLPSGKWLSVGRLDINTEGLLLFTSSGELANQLMHPRFGVEREYAVRVLGKLEEGDRAQLLEGVDVDGQRAAFKAIADGGGEGVNHWYRVIIAEGRNREVRKLFDTVGLTVSRLIRIRYGTVVLPRGLKRGVWVELGEDDVRAIRRLAHAPRDGAGQQPREAQGDAPQGQQAPQGRGQQPQRGQQPGKGQKGQQGQSFQGGQGGQAGPNGRQGGQGGGQGQGQGQGKQRGKHGGKPGFGGQGGQGGNFEQRRPDARAEMRPPRVDGPRADAPPRDDRDDRYDDDIPTHIPNPLEQTFDRRFATGSKRISAGFGRPTEEPVGGRGNGPRKGGSGPREPDPLQTSVGYIGADAYFSKPGGGGGKNRGGGGRRR